MKITVFSIIASTTLLISGCGGENTFESAFNPYTGTKLKAEQWRDQGGLNKQKDFYGTKIDHIRYSFQENGMVDQVEMRVEDGTSPESMRKALAKACKTNDASFKRVPNYPRGSVLLFPNGSSPGLGTTYDLSCIYEGDTQKLYIYSSLKTSNPK